MVRGSHHPGSSGSIDDARLSRRGARRAARGVTIVELLVGIAIGLLIIAAGIVFLTANMRDQRSLLLESRLMHDLRTAADLITRDLRRAGYWGASADGIWVPGSTSVSANPYDAVAPSGAASDGVGFRYSRDATENGSVDSNEQFGFRLRNGALEMQIGAGNWQALTDTGTLTVTAFSVTPSVQQISLGEACPTECVVGSTSCPPRLSVRSLAVQISGKAVADVTVVRSVRSDVRLRNDALAGSCTI